MTYREHAPHPELARHVECYWSIRARLDPGESLVDSVLPDGCMDILVTLGDPVETVHGASVAPHAVGTMTRPLEVLHRGTVDLLGVRFRPGAAVPYLDVPAAELTDRSVPLADLWTTRATDELVERLAEAEETRSRVAAVDAVLRGRLRDRGDRVDEPMLRVAGLVLSAAGRRTVGELADAAGLGRRQLERRFRAAVGIPPKAACRIARLRAAIRSMHSRPSASLSAVAHGAGYADQPHFTREFRALAGTTPGRYLGTLPGSRDDAFVQDARTRDR